MFQVTDAGAAILLLIALVSDVRTMRIPNALTVPAFAAGLIYHLAVEGMEGSVYAIVGAFTGFAPFFVLHLLKGIGAGDVKLFAALGAWIGSYSVLQTMMYAILYAGAVGLALLLMRRSFSQRVMAWAVMLLVPRQSGRMALPGLEAGKALRFPFMIAAVPGAVTAWLMIGS
ncbi:A24 family peptidase [Paenibacillus spongiae]|uniref:A24 family peptidase n=1 Tax=Paenibacillus spongiae TaxID=2909671 RepID=A0ABY5SMX8_9BACL|nr:A24 family peptidase [Paenibacillus spongiae]UVI33568.1 A24 family peptidase [Paenibacillus spongiae]